MPRKPRTAINSSYAHVIVQGIDKEYIFNSIYYKEKYKELLKKNVNSKVKIIAYCIMDNHAHIIFYIENIENLSECMRKINTTFAKMYNENENRVGFVFRDRYFLRQINSIEQLFSCMVYIHNNPVKAGMVNKPGEYNYSSYSEYILQYKKENLITPDAIKLVFGTNKTEGYLQQYFYIHEKRKDDEVNDIKEIGQKIDYYIIKKKLEQQMINSDNIIKILHTKYNLSERKISIIMSTNRNSVRKILLKSR